MCGRKTLTKDMQSIIEELAIEEWENPDNYIPSYNIAPTQTSPIIIDNGKRIVKPMRWGLIPSWAKDDKFGAKMINARIETLTEKPSYRSLVKTNRCIVIADGYYEWRKTVNGKIPYYIKDLNNNILPMAGLYDVWRNQDDELIYSYTVITKDAQKELAIIHNRMPLILHREHIDEWLKTNTNQFTTVLEAVQNVEPQLVNFTVSTTVNSVRNNSPDCIMPFN